MTDDTREILLDLARFVEKEKIFPRRDRFVATHRTRIAAFDELERERILGRWQGTYTTWTIQALLSIKSEVPFAAQELACARTVLDELVQVYCQVLTEVQEVADLQRRLATYDQGKLRRALILLGSLPIFHRLAIFIPTTADDNFGLTEQVLRIDPLAIFAAAPAAQFMGKETEREPDSGSRSHSTVKPARTSAPGAPRQGSVSTVANDTETPKVFISYSHDSLEHKNWVLALATALRGVGIDAILDQWDLEHGADVAKFMEGSLSDSARVVVVCSETYVAKADAGRGGAGYETMILTAEIMTNLATDKFIPIVRQNGTTLLPKPLGTRLFINFNDDDAYAASLEELVHALHRIRQSPKPPLGPRPSFSAAPHLNSATSTNLVGTANYYDEAHPELGTTLFFHDQMQNAFPGVRGVRWFEEPDGAGRRLSKLLADLKPWPIDRGGDLVPIWWWRGQRSSFIDEFEHAGGGRCVLDGQELQIHRLAAWRDDEYWRDFVYIETVPLPQAGPIPYESKTLDRLIKQSGYASEEYAIWGDRILSREEYDDGSVEIDGEIIEHNGAQVRTRYLSRYNLLIAAQFSPLNCHHESEVRLNRLLNEVALGSANFNELRESICRLPRYSRNDRTRRTNP